jgi:epoxyqueuosine reductase
MDSPLALAAQIKQKTLELGFDLAGIAPAHPSQYRTYLRQWLDDGQAGTMQYLSQRFDERTDPATYLPGAQSVVCAAVNYFVPLEPPPPDPAAQRGRVARYALGGDYHEWLTSRLHTLADWIRQIVPTAQTRTSVDTAPVMEKELAARAGLGWIGKNTCLIHPRAGSFLLLGEVITTLPLPADAPAIDRCGQCRRCLDACPTQALTEPYHMDARRCIAYLNIEHRQEIAADLAAKMGDWLFGCDICQDVCPFNRHPLPATQPQFTPRWKSGTLDLNDVLHWSPEDYAANLHGSAMKRVKLPMLQRNAKIIVENLRDHW